MKLLWCPACEDVIKLRTDGHRTCHCGQSWGRYMPDGLHAEVHGKAVPLGFVNVSFAHALRNRPESGQGERFTAFVIPRYCQNVQVNR